MARLKPRYSQESVEDLEEPYYCSPPQDEAEIICAGSDMEESPEETRARRQRYEDAAKQFAARKRPKLLSASLRGPLESGWANPWAYRPREPKEGDWCHSGAYDKPFERTHITRRSSQGLGYLSPNQAMAWFEVSAEGGWNSNPGNVMKSVERDSDVEIKVEAGGQDRAYPGNRAAERRNFVTNSYATTPHIGDAEENTKRPKRPVEAGWLKGSYVSKRARWDGPTLPSPTPMAMEAHRERRRPQIPTPAAAPRVLPLPLSGFESIQRPRQTPSMYQDRQVNLLNGHFDDELQDDTFSSFSPQISPPNVRTSSRARKSHSVSDLEPDELATISNDVRHSLAHITDNVPSSAQSCASSTNKLPPLHRSAIPSHYEEEDSFVTEVAPSSRDLEKFMFRKKRKATQTQKRSFEPMVQSSNSHNPRDNSVANELIPAHSHTPYLGSQTQDTRYSRPDKLSASMSRSQSSCLDPKQPVRETIGSPFPQSATVNSVALIRRDDEGAQSVTRTAVTPNWDPFSNISFNSMVESSPHHPKFLRTTSPGKPKTQKLGIPQQRDHPSLKPSQLPETEDDNGMTRFLANERRVADSVLPALRASQTLPDNTHYITSRGFMNDDETQDTRSRQNLGSFRVARNTISSQDPNNISTQSFSTTPACSRKTPNKLLSTKGKAPISRLQRFSFEAGFGDLLFSPIGNLHPVAADNHSQKRHSTVVVDSESHEHPADTSLGDYRAYMGLDCILTKPDKPANAAWYHNEQLLPGNTALDEAAEVTTKDPQLGTQTIMTKPHTSPINSNSLGQGSVLSEPEKITGDRGAITGTPNPKSSIRKPSSQTRPISSPQTSFQKPGSLASRKSSVASAAGAAETTSQSKESTTVSIDKQPLSQDETSPQVAADTHNHQFDESYLIGGGPRRVGRACPNKVTTPSQVEQAELEENEITMSTQSYNDTHTLDAVSVQNLPPRPIMQVVQSPFAQELRISPKAVVQAGIVEDEVTMSPQSSNSTGTSNVVSAKKQTPLPITQVVQSPFAQELFVPSKPILQFESSDEVLADAESETSWEDRAPQSPWAVETANDNRAQTLISAAQAILHEPLQDPELSFSTALADIIPRRQVKTTEVDEITRASSPDSDNDDFEITAFRDIMSASPSPVHKTPPSARVPTNTQQLVNAALQNPWTSSLKKPTSKRPRKSVTFARQPSEEPPKAEESELKETRVSPPPDDDILNEVMFGKEFTQATPFKNHFNVARKFSKILPNSSQTPVKSPALSAQAEAFIAADQSRPSVEHESPTRHLMPRSQTDENSHWRDWEPERSVEAASPRRSPSRERMSIGMANFDMDEALNSMEDFLGDWSVEAEIKKTQEASSSRRKSEDNGARRRRLFGIA